MSARSPKKAVIKHDDPRKFLLVADTDGTWYVRRVKWTIDDVERGLMVYECDAPVGQGFDSAERAVSAMRIAFRKQNGKPEKKS